MAHDVFISYSTKDKTVADAVCAALEADNVRCWIAPRDVLPGLSYGQGIIEALNASRLLVLVFTGNSNTSRHVMREVERAVNKGVPVVSFRVEDVAPTPTMEYFISADHWLDALTPPLDAHVRKLVETVKQLRGRQAPQGGEASQGGEVTQSQEASRAAAPAREQQQTFAPRGEQRPTAAPPKPAVTTVTERQHAASPPPERQHSAPPDAFATAPLTAPFNAPPREPSAPPVAAARQTNMRPLLVVGLIALAGVALLIGVMSFFWFGGEDVPPAAAVSGADVASGAGKRGQQPGQSGAGERRASTNGAASQPKLLLAGHSEDVRTCAFSPDGKLVAGGGGDKAVRLWDAETGELLQTLDGLEAGVTSLAFSPGGDMLAVALDYVPGRQDYSLLVYEVNDGKVGEVTQTLTNVSGVVSSVAFSADGKILLGGGRPARLWDAADWSLKQESIDPGVNPAFALSPDGRLLATGGTNENPVKLWDAEGGELKLTLEGHGKGVLALAFSPDGRTLASGSYDDTARLWDAQTGEPKLTLNEDALSAIFSVAFSPDGATMATGSYHAVKLWDARTGALKRTLVAENMGITHQLAFSPDGKTLAGAGDKTVKLWDVGESAAEPGFGPSPAAPSRKS